jgi:hypothetical protein
MISDPRYFPEVLQVVPGDDYRLYIYFDDGTIHLYDVKPLLAGKVFQPLKDLSRFHRTLTVLNGTVAWDLPGDRDERACVDLDPLLLYRESAEVEESDWLKPGPQPAEAAP